MSVTIRRMESAELDDVVRLSLAAWAPVFQSFQQVLGSTIYDLLYPDWQEAQSKVVRDICDDLEKNTTLVAVVDENVAGFISYELNTRDSVGVVHLLAVDPAYQNLHIGTDLNNAALDAMKQSGMKLAEVSTGGDPGHAPARRCYEKAGYTPLPTVCYLKAL